MNNVLTQSGNRAIRTGSALSLVLGLVFSLVLFPVASLASANSQATTQANALVTIPAGGTANLTIRGFCLDYGKPFPTGDTTAKGLADTKVRAALNYSIQKGYTDNNARQVELAIWNLRDNTWHATPHDLGTEIVTNATDANLPAAGTGTSLTDAITQGKLSATAKFTPQTSDEFYGDGQVTLKNSGTADLQVYMPVGVVFTAGANGSFQDLVAYQLNVAAQVTGTASPAATGTVSGTASPAVTASPIVTGTASPAASATSVVTGTATVGEASPTAVGTAAASPTTMVETPTVVATATAGAVATETPMATATTPAGGNVLPQTGSGSGNGPGGAPLAILIAGILLTLIGSTALVASKRRA